MLLAMLMLSCYMEAAAVNPNSKEQASDCAVGRMQKPDDMLAALCDREGNQTNVEVTGTGGLDDQVDDGVICVDGIILRSRPWSHGSKGSCQKRT